MNMASLFRAETRSAWTLRVILYVAVVATMTLIVQLLVWFL
jgi:hypothetical protein